MAHAKPARVDQGEVRHKARPGQARRREARLGPASAGQPSTIQANLSKSSQPKRGRQPRPAQASAAQPSANPGKPRPAQASAAQPSPAQPMLNPPLAKLRVFPRSGLIFPGQFEPKACPASPAHRNSPTLQREIGFPGLAQRSELFLGFPWPGPNLS